MPVDYGNKSESEFYEKGSSSELVPRKIDIYSEKTNLNIEIA